MLERNIFNHFNFNNNHLLVPNENTLNSIEVGGLVPLCAELSAAIYNPGYFVPPGWNLFHTYNDGDYRGAFYTRNLVTTNAQVIVVHRGTVFRADNLYGDFQIARGNLPAQINSVNKFLFDAVNKLVNIYKPDGDDNPETDHLEMIKYLQVITTGHSLGAILSDYVGLNAHVSITFENPGSKPILQSALIGMKYPPDMIAAKLNTMKNVSQAYQAGVNIINTCNEQVGRTFRIGNLAYKYYDYHSVIVKEFPPSNVYTNNLDYIKDYSFDQHSIDKIKNYILNGHPTIEIINPIGFQAGYAEYLNPSNKPYWDGYLKNLWNDPSFFGEANRQKYNNDEKAFIDDSYVKLTEVYNEARKVIFSNESNEKLFNSKLNHFKPAPKETDKIIEEFTLIEKENIQEEKRSRCSVM